MIFESTYVTAYASGFYLYGLQDVLQGAIDLDASSELKIMLVNTDYVFDNSEQYLDTAESLDLTSCEIDCTNYTNGFGGAGRKDATVSVEVSETDDSVSLVLDDLTWTTLGGASNDNIGWAVLFKPGASDDTTAVPIFCWDLDDVATNGGDFKLDFSSTGNITFS